MSLEMPETGREKEAAAQHEEEQRRHEQTIMDNERHPVDPIDYHHMKEAKEPGEAFEAYRERAERHHVAQENHELVEEYNTQFRNNE